MKKFIYKGLLMGVFCLALGQLTMAQPAAVPPPPPSPAIVPDAVITEDGGPTEIVIRQKGDKDAKVVLEIKNGDFFINGKPLEKFDDQNIIIEKRKFDENTDWPNMTYSLSPFRDNRMNDDMTERYLANIDRQKNLQKSIKIRMNSAFLGVSSRKAEKGGATVLEVTKGSPAEKAGIKKGDIITKLNETKIESPETLYETVHNLKPGDKVTIILTRDGKEQTVVATLDKSDVGAKDFNYNYNYKFKMPPMPDMGDIQFDGNWEPRQPKLGIKAQDAEDGKGVNVLEVEDSSAAWKAGLKKGDIILQFDGSEVNSTNELVEQFQDARRKSTIKVKIQRGGTTQDLDIKIPRKLKTAEL
jgi:serine protease Do